MNNGDLSESVIKFYLNKFDTVNDIVKKNVQDFIDFELNNLFYGPGDEYRIAVLGAFDTWPYLDFICRILTNRGYLCITSRYIYHKFKDKIIRFPTTLIKQYTSEAFQMKRLLKKIIQNCLLAIINYSVSAAHYIETDWCSEQDNLNIIGIAYVRNTYKLKNCKYLKIKSIPKSTSFYSMCDVIEDFSDWKAWDCISIQNFCPFKQQDISKNILEYYFSSDKTSKLISVENLEDLPYVFDDIFKNIENITPLDIKYQVRFEERISKLNIKAELLEFLFLNKGLEVLLFLKLCWEILKKILKFEDITLELLDLFQKIKNLDEFAFDSTEKENLIDSLDNSIEDKNILKEIFLKNNRMQFYSLNGIITIREIIFNNFGNFVINFLVENNFLESKNCFWFLTSKSHTLLNNLNIYDAEVVKTLINKYNEEKSKFNHRYRREGLGFALEQPEFLTYHHLESFDQLKINFSKKISSTDQEEIQKHMDKEEYDKVIDYINKVHEKDPEYKELFFDKGMIFFIQKKYEQAINSFNENLVDDTYDELSLLYKGICLYELDKDEEAIKCYDKILEFKPDDNHVIFHKALSLLNLKDYKGALEYFSNILKKEPNNINALGCKGIALSELQRYEEAIEYFNRILEIEPNDKYTLSNKGETLSELQKYDEAIEYFNKILEIEPNDIRALGNKGIALSQLQRYEEAMEYFNKILEIDPNDTSALGNKGIALIELQRYEEAMEYFNKILEIDPNDISTLGNKGIALIELQRYEEAINCFDNILETNPNDLHALYHKSLTLDDSGKYEEAIKYYDKILDIDPTNIKTWVNKGSILFNHFKKFKKALKCFERALEIDPDFIIALTNIANALVELERYDDALEYYNNALEKDPNYVDALACKGNLLAKLGKLIEAKECFQKVLKIESNDPSSLYNSSCLASLLNNEEEALQLLKKVVELDNEYKKLAEEDTDFNNIKDSKKFKKIIQ